MKSFHLRGETTDGDYLLRASHDYQKIVEYLSLDNQLSLIRG